MEEEKIVKEFFDFEFYNSYSSFINKNYDDEVLNKCLAEFYDSFIYNVIYTYKTYLTINELFIIVKSKNINMTKRPYYVCLPTYNSLLKTDNIYKFLLFQKPDTKKILIDLNKILNYYNIQVNNSKSNNKKEVYVDENMCVSISEAIKGVE